MEQTSEFEIKVWALSQEKDWELSGHDARWIEGLLNWEGEVQEDTVTRVNQLYEKVFPYG